jgi:hypothetical protein
MPDHVSFQTAISKEHGAKTKVTARSVLQSVENRAAMLSANTREGQAESMDRMAELVE